MSKTKIKSSMIHLKDLEDIKSYSATRIYRVWFNDTLTQYSLVKTTGRWTILGPECRIELKNKPAVNRKIKEIIVKEQTQKQEVADKLEHKQKLAKRLKYKKRGVKKK